ncbi:MAG: YfhO family protein [Calditrichaeota bacterium]|nr:YfhO family protein [Calditrichota bacterium]
MAKIKKKKPKKSPSGGASPRLQSATSFLDQLEQPRSILIFFVALLVFLTVFYKPLAIDGLEVTGTDLVSGIGKRHQIIQFQKQTGEWALWNPYIFGGMPYYHLYRPIIWSIDRVLIYLDRVLDWRVLYFWAGGLGIFLLVKFLGLSALSGMLAAIGFILMPHFQALIVVGHFTKFRALMWMPYVLLTFLYFLRHRNVLGMLLFSWAMALQMRTQHYQIIFYTLMMLLFVGIVPYLKPALEKRWGDFLRWNGMFAVSLVLVVLMVAQPLLPIRDYTPYSTRGGQAIHLKKQVTEKEKKGVGFDYATNWSYTVSEFWNFIIPKFHGGTSNEVYEGDAYPQLRGRTLPLYWGSLPFTQSYEYMGILLIFLALVAIVFRWKDPVVKSFAFLTLFALLLSLGKHFAALYKLFFYYVPYFDKFRVPMMILTLVMFNVSVLAAYGLDFLLRNPIGEPALRQKLLVLSGGVGILLIIPLLFGSSFSLASAGEFQRLAAQIGQQRAQQWVDILREIRLEILKASTLRTLLFLTVFVATLVAVFQKWMNPAAFGVLVVMLVGVDLGWISSKYLEGKFGDIKAIEKEVYRKNALDPIISRDTTMFRVAPPFEVITNDTRWSYYYQSIGGYSPAKLQVIQDIIDNNLLQPAQAGLPFNLNVVSMLNTRYLVSSMPFRHPALQFLGEDRSVNLKLYLNREALPRAFFVDSVEVIPDGVKRLKRLNDSDFNPSRIAILEKPLPHPVRKPDSSRVAVTHFDPNRVEFNVYASQPGLLVVSEIYYPRGWKAILDGEQELEIYKTNHVLRSVWMPAGEHRLQFIFRPASFFLGIRLSLIGFLIVYVGLAFALYRELGDQMRRSWRSFRGRS